MRAVTAGTPLRTGRHQVRMDFAYDGGGIGKGGAATLFVDGNQVGSARVERTHAFNYSLCETAGSVGTTARPSPTSTPDEFNAELCRFLMATPPERRIGARRRSSWQTQWACELLLAERLADPDQGTSSPQVKEANGRPVPGLLDGSGPSEPPRELGGG